MMCFYVFIMRICLGNVKNPNTTTFITSGIILGFVLIAMVYIKTGDYPLSAYGLTMKPEFDTDLMEKNHPEIYRSELKI